MKNICALTIALISIGIIPNVQVEANVLDIVEAYRDQINYKEEKIQSLDSKILALTLKPENMEIWKELSCERRKAMRSYIHSANKILESKELKSPELKNAEEIKSYFEKLLFTLYSRRGSGITKLCFREQYNRI